MAHRLPQHIVSCLEEAARAASLENASFDGMASNKTITVTEHWDGAKPKDFASMTDLIRDKVRLHHNSWIIGPIKLVLKWSESVDDGSMKEYDILGRLRSPFPNPEVLEQAHKEITELRQHVAALESFKRKVDSAIAGLKEDGYEDL